MSRRRLLVGSNLDWHFSRAGRKQTVAVRSRFQVKDSHVLRDAALEGCGIVLQGDFSVKDDLAAGRFTSCSQRRPRTRKLRGFNDIMGEAL